MKVFEISYVDQVVSPKAMTIQIKAKSKNEAIREFNKFCCGCQIKKVRTM